MAGAHDNQPGFVWIPWYASVFRQETFAEAVAEIAPIALRYGAVKYSVQRSLDDRYRITQMAWFERRSDFYRFWEGPEMVGFRQMYAGHYQIPVVYEWREEIATGEIGPEVPGVAEAAAGPSPEPTAAS